MDWLFLSEVILAGSGSGALYALAGVAFVVIYKATKVVNLAIGEILMLGGYAFFGLVAGMGLPAWAALPLAVLCGGLLGGFVELGWGADPLRLPEFISNQPIFLGEAYLAPKVAYGFVAATIVITLFILAFRFSRGGVALRATAG